MKGSGPHVVAIKSHVDLIDLITMLRDHLGDSLRVRGGAGHCQRPALVEVDLWVDQQQDDSHGACGASPIGVTDNFMIYEI